MGFVIRSSASEYALNDEPLLLGCSPSAGFRIEGSGVEAVHVGVNAARIEAFADCEVGGVTLKRGAARALVPCVITLGSEAIEIAASEDSEDLSTRELAMGAAVGPGKLWSYAVVVEGRSAGNLLVLREERAYRVGRASACELIVEDPEASREHLEIIRRGDQILVRDLGSTGGSWLGRRQLDGGRKAEWPADRMLRIGATVIALVRPAPLLERPIRPAPSVEPRVPPSAATSAAEIDVEPSGPPSEPDVHSTRYAEQVDSQREPDARAAGPVASIVEPVARPPAWRAPPSQRFLRTAPGVLLFVLIAAVLASLIWVIFGGE